VNGEISGQGRATYANGDVYEGLFERGKRQGAGTMTYASGTAETGDWNNGILAGTEAQPTAQTADQ